MSKKIFVTKMMSSEDSMKEDKKECSKVCLGGAKLSTGCFQIWTLYLKRRKVSPRQEAAKAKETVGTITRPAPLWGNEGTVNDK